MTRNEHIEWCKTRAKEIAETGDINDAFASMCSDLNKHDETRDHPAIELGFKLLISKNLQTKEEMLNFIDGFQ